VENLVLGGGVDGFESFIMLSSLAATTNFVEGRLFDTLAGRLTKEFLMKLCVGHFQKFPAAIK
jgi:hypothetical protein